MSKKVIVSIQKIIDIERELKYIFKKDVIKIIDVNRSKYLFQQWKELTKYKEEK